MLETTSSFKLEEIAAKCVHSAMNFFFDFYTGGSKRPVFFDIATTASVLHSLTDRYQTIRAECARLLDERDGLPRYHDLDPHVTRISQGNQPDKAWRVFLLNAMGETPEAAQRACPTTTGLLASIPDVYLAFFSVLDPGKSIPRHQGPYRGYLRYHLGLRVPALAPPSLMIKDRTYTWEEGKAVLFDDSWDHEVVNRSAEPRVVLIVDIVRPMPAFPTAVARGFARWVAKPLYGRRLIERTT